MNAYTNRAVFLDRDGVINRDVGYVHRWADFEFNDGVVPALEKLQTAGFRLVIVTNQSGIARGYFSEQQYESLTQKLCDALAHDGVHIDAVYHCPHHPEGVIPEFSVNCGCRKPAPGMLLRAAQEHQLNLSSSLLVGDKISDIQAAAAAGIRRAFLLSAHSKIGHFETGDGLQVEVKQSLADCADHVLSEIQNGKKHPNQTM